MSQHSRRTTRWSKWKIRIGVVAALISVLILLPPSGGTVSGMRSLPRAIVYNEEWGPLAGATLEEAARNKEAEDREYLAALIQAYGLSPVLLEWLGKWWHPCWPTIAMPWYPADFPEPLPWIEDLDPSTGCDYSSVWTLPYPGATESNPSGLWDRWPFHDVEDLKDSAAAQEAEDRRWISAQLARNPNEDLAGRLCWAPVIMPWYPDDFPLPAVWVDDLDADTWCAPKDIPDDSSQSCTWDGSTVDPMWWQIEQNRLQAGLERVIAENAPGMSLDEASAQEWAGKINVGQDVWMLDLPSWVRNMISPMSCELVVASVVDQLPGSPEGTKWESVTDWEAWTNQAIAEDRAWLESEIAMRGSQPGEEWVWNPCWPPEAMSWYPSDFPPPLEWTSYESGCK